MGITPTASSRRVPRRPKNLPADVETLAWAAENLGVSMSTVYRLAERGELPGGFKVGGQWGVSVLRLRAAIHNEGVA